MAQLNVCDGKTHETLTTAYAEIMEVDSGGYATYVTDVCRDCLRDKLEVWRTRGLRKDKTYSIKLL